MAVELNVIVLRYFHPASNRARYHPTAKPLRKPKKTEKPKAQWQIHSKTIEKTNISNPIA